ncbi:virulence-associated E family protein, partial [Escherichia coli]|nr:virulence-associated E family protein [Escherichia coli]
SFAEKDDDLARKMRGRLVAEIGELRGLNTKELESIKAFVTRTHENWIPKYREFATQFPRRLVFVGTTNEDEFLADKTGNRRWLPVEV